MPPFQIMSTCALSRALIRSFGARLSAAMPKRCFICGLMAMLLAAREKMPPPAEISVLS
ncbi:hypothetical protein D3C84_1283300 [compost metagenome]